MNSGDDEATCEEDYCTGTAAVADAPVVRRGEAVGLALGMGGGKALPE